MRIAIVGMGVAGSYLAARWADEHQLSCYERFRNDKFDAVCAWGTTKEVIARLVKPAGLNFDDYVLHDGQQLVIATPEETVTIRLKGLCCFDKHRFERDLAAKVSVRYGSWVTQPPTQKGYDLIVDATGLSRPLLPRLAEDLLIPCLQYKVKFRTRPYDDFVVRPFPGMSGYWWYFPLENGYAHVGAGDYYKRHIPALQRFLRETGGEIVKTVGRPVRVTPPALCEPFYQGRVVGVGESIGTVYPLLGEGIIPSLQCADLLAEHLDDLSRYRARVLKQFHIYHAVYRFIRAKIAGQFSFVKQAPNLIAGFLHMKRNERRYGMEIKLRDLLKIARV